MRVSRAFVTALLFAVGCGGTTALEPTGTLAADAGLSATCSAFAQAECSKRSSCSSGTLITRDYGDMATCVERETLSCTNSVSAPKTGKTVALVAACVNDLPSVSCADFLDGNTTSPCSPPGPGAIGAACAFDAQCATFFCANQRYSVCGTCAAAPANGTSCATSNCGTNQECAWTAAVVNVCEPDVSNGGSCGENSSPGCGADLSCVGASLTTGGTCEAAVDTLGAACGTANMKPGCDGTLGLHCTGSGTSEACAAIQYVGDGMPCGELADGGFAECTAGTCYSLGGPFTSTLLPSGTCKAYAADGAACDTRSGPGCMSGARCVTTGSGTAGTCTPPAPALSAMCK